MSIYSRTRRITHLRYDIARVREIFSAMFLEPRMLSGISQMVPEWRQTYRNIYGKYRNGSGKFRKFWMYRKLPEGGTHRPIAGWVLRAPWAGRLAGQLAEWEGGTPPPSTRIGGGGGDPSPLPFPISLGTSILGQFEFEKVESFIYGGLGATKT
jgi:hypothetical protein